jgi:3',5'-cyclic-AMP phosphodiesterase
VPFTIVQLTDPHIGAAWSPDAISALAATVNAVGQVLRGPPDAVIVSGDIANTPTASEYHQARTALGAFDAPLYVLPGNHDDRDLLRRHFDLPDTDTDDGRVSYVARLGPVRLVVLDGLPFRGGGPLPTSPVDRGRSRTSRHKRSARRGAGARHPQHRCSARA